MKISLDKVGKRYQSNWLFRNISFHFESGNRYALLGANGSGKSTLLRLIAGMQHANTGTISYEHRQKPLAAENVYAHISYCAPGMDLIEEMSLTEFLHFHFTFKQPKKGFDIETIIAASGLGPARHKFIHEYSSGMKQRVKLAQAFFSDTPVLLLDEPCTNLDTQGVALYQQWLDNYSAGQLVVIASNDEREYSGAQRTISVQDYHSP